MKGKMEVPIPKRTKGMRREEQTRKVARMVEKMGTAKADREAPENDRS
jgi:hypothetical protein